MFTPRIHSNCSPNASGYQEKALPIFIHIHHRVIPTIRVPVKTLCREWVLHLWVWREETTQYGVIQTGVHIDDAETIVVLVSSEASVEGEVAAVLINSPVGGTHAVPPWVKVAALHHLSAAVHYAIPTSEEVGLHIIEAVGIGGDVMYM